MNISLLLLSELSLEIIIFTYLSNNKKSFICNLNFLLFFKNYFCLIISPQLTEIIIAILISVLSCRFTLLTFTFYIRILLIFQINLLVFCNLKTAQKILILELHEKPFKDLLILDYEVICERNKKDINVLSSSLHNNQLLICKLTPTIFIIITDL